MRNRAQNENNSNKNLADDVAAAQPASRESILAQSIAGTVNTPENFYNTLSTVCDYIDWVITLPRGGQVYTNVFANDAAANQTSFAPHHLNDDSYNSASAFNNIVYQDPSHSDQGLTPIGWAFVGVVALPVTYGIARRVYQIYHKRELNSYGYLKRRLNEVAKDLGVQKTFKKDDIMAGFNDILKNGQIKNIEPVTESPLSTTDELVGSQVIKTVVDYDEYFEPNAFIKTINKITATSPAQWVGKAWDFVCNQSLYFWVIGFPVGLALGAAAAAATPILIATTAAIGGAGLLYEGIYWLYKKLTHTVDAENKEEEAQINKLKQRYFMQQEHEMIMKMLHNEYDIQQDLNVEEVLEDVHDAEGSYEIDKNSRKVIRILSKKSNNHAAPVNNRHGEFSLQSPQEIFSTTLGKHLLGSQRERDARLGITTAAAAVSGFIITTFVLYFSSCAIGLIAGAGALATALLGTELTFFSSLSIGAFFGVTTYCKTRAAQLDYEKKVYQTLSVEYKPGTGVNKADKFSELYDQVETKKAQIAQLRNDLQKLGKKDEKSLLSKYDLKKVDVFNDYYFEKQKHSPSLFTLFKKGLNRLYSLIGGGESGVYLVRTLFLVGGIAAGAIAAAATGALVPFLIATAVAAAVWGTIKLVQYQLDRNQEHREAFLNDIDNRIIYLELKDKELNAVLQKLEHNKEKALNEYEKNRKLDNALRIISRKKQEYGCPVSRKESTPLISKKDYKQDMLNTEKKSESTARRKWSFCQQPVGDFDSHERNDYKQLVGHRYSKQGVKSW